MGGLLLSGIPGIEDKVGNRLREAGMINVMENKVLGPMLREQYTQGQEEGHIAGKQEGLREGMQLAGRSVLLALLNEKFGKLPKWVPRMLEDATAEELQVWATRVLHSGSVEEALQ